jgi:hypothetical protein
MPEQAFQGTILEGRKRRYTIINERDFEKYVPSMQKESFEPEMNNVLKEIELGRELDNKEPFNNYVVINTDEPYINEIIRVMKRNNHWEGEIPKFYIDDLDGTEFIRDSDVGKGMISYEYNSDGWWTGKVKVVWPDGSGQPVGLDDAQRFFDEGQWTLIR